MDQNTERRPRRPDVTSLHAGARADDRWPGPPRDWSDAARWPVWNTTLRLSVTSRERLADARRLVIDQMVAIDDAANPFRPDSEVRALQRSAGRAVRVSALLAELLTVSLRAAQLSEGDLDPIAEAAGRERGRGPLPDLPGQDWHSIRRKGGQVTLPPGTLLDLSAMAGAHAADRAARLIHRRLNVGVRVGIGGDVVTAGRAPEDDWDTLLNAHPAARCVPVRAQDATSAVSTIASHQWREGDRPRVYTFLPGSSRSTVTRWRSVSVAAYPCTYAKALSMTAMLRGDTAPRWLRAIGVPARRVDVNGEVTTVGRWRAGEAA